MKFNLPINNFTSGEWSPKMRSLINTEEYPRSCKELTNMLVQMQGGAQYRAGTRTLNFDLSLYESSIGPSNTEPTKDFKLIPYKNSQGFSTMILFTLDGDLTTYPVVKSIAGTASYTGCTPRDLKYQQVGDYLIIVDSGTNNFPPAVFYYDQITNGYKFVFWSSFMDINGGNTYRSIPFSEIKALDNDVTMSIPTGTYNVGNTFMVTASGPFFTNLFGSVGQYIRVANSTTVDAVLKITSYIDNQRVNVQVIRTIAPLAGPFTFGSTANSSSFWQTSEWGRKVSGSTVYNGYPRTVIAYQGRVIFGGIFSKPDTLWGSRIGSIFDFQEVPNVNTTGVSGYSSAAYANDNSRPFALTPNSPEVSSIVALSAGKTLSIHTTQSEIVAYGSNGALGPVNVVFESSTSFGAAPVQPARVNNFETFIQANGYKVRDLIYNQNEDQYKSSDLGFLAEHFFLRSTDAGISSSELTNASSYFPVDDIIECMKYESRSSYLLVRTRRGKVFYLTLDRDYKVNAWGRIVLGYNGTDTYPYDSSPVVLAMGVAEYSYGRSTLYMITKRTINGVTKIVNEYIDRISIETENISTTANPYIDRGNYLDCAWAATAVGATPTVSWKVDPGASVARFPNTTVSIFADGSYVGEVTLGSDNEGAFTLARAASFVTIGFKYPGVLITSGLEVGGQIGQPLGRIKRVDEVVVRVHKSGSGKIGRSEDTLEELPIRNSNATLGLQTPYFTGDKVVTFSEGYERDYSIIVRQDKPYPLYVVSVAARGVTYD